MDINGVHNNNSSASFGCHIPANCFDAVILIYLPKIMDENLERLQQLFSLESRKKDDSACSDQMKI